MPDAPVSDAGNEPAGRGGGGPLGLSWLMWGGVAVATFVAVWYLRGRTSSPTSSSSSTGDLSNLPTDSGVTSTDPLTAESLLAALNQLNSNLGKTSSGNSVNQPASTPSRSSSGPLHLTPRAASVGRSVTTGRLTGATSTARVAAPHPNSPKTTVSQGVVARLSAAAPGFRDTGPATAMPQPKPGITIPLSPYGPALDLRIGDIKIV